MWGVNFPFNKNPCLKIPKYHAPNDPSSRAFAYCSCKQDTKERTGTEKQFCRIERTFRSDHLVDHLQSWSLILLSDQTGN